MLMLLNEIETVHITIEFKTQISIQNPSGFHPCDISVKDQDISVRLRPACCCNFVEKTGGYHENKYN